VPLTVPVLYEIFSFPSDSARQVPVESSLTSVVCCPFSDSVVVSSEDQQKSPVCWLLAGFCEHGW
jgi:hypothetical protein